MVTGRLGVGNWMDWGKELKCELDLLMQLCNFYRLRPTFALTVYFVVSDFCFICWQR